MCVIPLGGSETQHMRPTTVSRSSIISYENLSFVLGKSQTAADPDAWHNVIRWRFATAVTHFAGMERGILALVEGNERVDLSMKLMQPLQKLYLLSVYIHTI
jgi:hypothetical protein